MFSCHTLALGPIDTNAYLLQAQNTALLIDAPPGCADAIEPLLGGRRLVALLLTHGHWDHVWDAAAVKERYQVDCYAHPADQFLWGGQRGDNRPAPFKVEHALEDGTALEWEEFRCQVLHTPGHSPGGVVFVFAQRETIFSGDTLFHRSVGATHFPGGDFVQLQRNIRSRLYTLADSWQVYPGHGRPTTIGEEKALNPYVTAQP